MDEADDMNMLGKKRKIPYHVFFKDARHVFKKDELGLEIARIAFPAALALTADPIASLIDTAFIGRIGPVELAAVGVAIAVFNQVSRIAIFPLVSITTSFVAEEDTVGRVNIEDQQSDNLEKAFPKNSEMKALITEVDSDRTVQKLSCGIGGQSKMFKHDHEKRHIPSASSALIIGGVLGLLQAIFLILGAKPILELMGVKSDSPMLTPARQYLTLRSLGAPAILLSLATQGIFRGFKDTKTPLYATVAGDITNIILTANTVKRNSYSIMASYDEAPHEDVANDDFTTDQVEENNAPSNNVVDEGTENPSQKLQQDDTEAISQDNIMNERTRHAKPTGGYREPGDNEGIPVDS